MAPNRLRERAYSLATRFSWLAIGADIYALAIVELRGVCRFLQRLADG